MKSSRCTSMALAAFLQFAPFAARTVPALPSLLTSPAAILVKWFLGALVIGGSMHTVSAATAVLASAKSVSGQVGTRLSYQIRINDGKNRQPGSWTIGGKKFSASGSTTNGMPPGLALALNTAIIGGIPSGPGTFPVTLTAWENGNQSGGRLTFTVTFGITGIASPPTIATPPQGGTVTEGAPFTFSVAATGDNPLTYQWFHDGNPVTGATLPTLDIPATSLSDAGDWTVEIRNPAGTATSPTVTLTVNPAVTPTAIVAAPQSIALHAGDPLELTVTATGSPPLAYLWKKDGSPIPGAPDSPTFLVAAVSGTDAGSYSVVVSGPGGAQSSPPATVALVPLRLALPSPGEGANIRLSATTIPGRRYRLESATSLLDSAWNAALEFTASGDTTDLTQASGSSFAAFWRYRALP